MKNSLNLSKIKLYDHIFGYTVEKIVQLNEIKAIYYLLNHNKTGAQHIHIENNDIENTFGVTFKTIPSDSTGIAHILEHTVLCGSLNFPVRDPFFSMLKRSLSTFMNAFTSSDWTMYPFSTQNKKDYYNLMSVYMDSVFFPKIDKLSFKQEGFRIDFENPTKEDSLVYKGIVYNEMKGVMSSPNQVMNHSLLNALYPDTTYSNNSGGDPAKIPSLTHEKLKQFHKRYYHPSNSFFFTYGNLPLESHLKYINNSFLKKFNRIAPNSDVASQRPWENPKTLYYYYPLSKDKNPKKKSQVCVAWLTSDIRNTFEILVLSFLEQILLGNSASPLRKALMDSNLGTSLSDGTGFNAENRNTMFACGIKDVEESNATEIENIILKTLNDLVTKGIDKILIDSVLHQIEFSQKERTNIPYPFGIKILMSISGCWFHGGNPENILETDINLDKIKNYILQGGFFEKKITQYFLKNKHKVLLILKPDQNMEENESLRVKKELLKIRNHMSNSDLDKLKQESSSLNKLREKQENLSCLPTLQLEDIPIYIDRINPPININNINNLFAYNQDTSGIIYFNGLIGLGSLKEDLFPLIPFFCHVFSRVGTTKSKYTKFVQNIDLYTGGINLIPHSNTIFDSKGLCLPFISLNSKCLTRNKGKMFELIQELINQIDFNDTNRMLQLLLEYKAGIESMILPNGHSLALSLASRNFSDANYLNEMWSGISQFHTIKKILKETNKHNMNILTDKLHYISNSIFSRKNFKIALIGEKDDLFLIQKNIEDFFDSISTEKEIGFEPVSFNLGNKYFYEGWTTSTSISFVAQTFETVTMEHEDSPALSVISKIITSMYLHKEIREKGGAYGGFSLYNSENGLFSFCSYRDPNILKTLTAYSGVSNFICSNNLKENDIKEAILQVCSDIDKPDSPSTAAKKDFLRRIIGFSDDVRQNYKTSLLKLNKNCIMKVAKKYFDSEKVVPSTAMISNKQLLAKVSEKSRDLLLNINSI